MEFQRVDDDSFDEMGVDNAKDPTDDGPGQEWEFRTQLHRTLLHHNLPMVYLVDSLSSKNSVGKDDSTLAHLKIQTQTQKIHQISFSQASNEEHESLHTNFILLRLSVSVALHFLVT